MNFHTGIKLCSGRFLDLSGPALVMAVINCNDDSFYPASRSKADEAAEKALAAQACGAAIIDFGGESSRPGSSYIDAGEELRRVIPAIEMFRKKSNLPISVDTRKAVVAAAALDAGADIVNDISALGDDPQMAGLCARRGAAVVLVHMKGTPAGMRDTPVYSDVTAEVRDFLAEAADRAVRAGIDRNRIIIDPGFGFNKNTADNLVLLARLAEIRLTGYPLLAGLSRKTFIGEITGRPIQNRLAGTMAANAAAIWAGADIIRLHDVQEGVDLARTLYEIKKKEKFGT
ncbi:MAG: dihydropteroate synthase [Treponema sp.]|nr:dihydropteroate synthase [Treponema sp.]